MSASASLRKSCCAAGSCLEIGSKADCRRRTSQCASLHSCTHRRRCLLLTRRCRALRMCGCSLFPQEGCPLARHGREGQDKTASDFGVCVAGPVRPLVAVPLGPSLQHAHKPPTHKPPLAHRLETDKDSYFRRTSERSSAGNVSRSVGKEWPHSFPAGLSYHELTIVHILECALSGVVASKHRGCSA